MKTRYLRVTCDIANGPGVRTSLFVSGCTHHCKNCFNQEAWDFNYGEPFTADIQQQILDECAPSYNCRSESFGR